MGSEKSTKEKQKSPTDEKDDSDVDASAAASPGTDAPNGGGEGRAAAATDGNGGPSAATQDDGYVTIRLAARSAKPPILVSFQGHPIPRDDEEIAFTLQRNVADKTKEAHRILLGEGPRSDYWGVNYGKSSHKHDLANFCVGVLDEATKELKLYPPTHLYSLKSQLRSAQAAGAAASEDVGELGYLQKRTALADAFGSKKRQKQLKVEEAKKINAESAVGADALSSALAAASSAAAASTDGTTAAAAAAANSELDGAARAEEAARRNFLPPYHAEAATPQGVYLLAELVPAEVMNATRAEVEAFVTAHSASGGSSWLREMTRELSGANHTHRQKFPEFVLSRLRNVKAPPPPEQVQQLLFLGYLAVFQAAAPFKATTPITIAKDLKMPEAIVRFLISRFVLESHEAAPNNTRKRPYRLTKEGAQRLCAHALCLAMVLNGCSLEFEALASDLKLPSAEAAQLTRQLGCRVAGGTARLVVPLEFPRRMKKTAKKY